MRTCFSHIAFKKLLSFVGLYILLTAAFAAPCSAQNFNGVTTFLTTIVKTVTGPFGVAVSALAVMAVGFSFMTGRMDWTFAVSVIMGIAIVFGGASFVGSLAPH
ncbi:TrbC/VirB2 family protein (plasmid) [Bradyrhizobium sp. CCGUVB1N3]|uniref:TrbC/VirB2 family protein n=1 Tax=Bradyrhizobium sp. CCGUVB1N3 TaxID=2949629 RepID=UPI0020B2B88D|nr:TrbC/VirB2 family protein [Bradyrhizobium sp. CCGUVB1N3]MCP3477821.1 TrbC/VirB2 family protein [Bradyrhizobium sp. CCGUVB1N3]